MPNIEDKILRLTLRNEFNDDTLILPNEAIGWDSIKIVLERDYDSFGFNQFFDGQLTFFREGAAFIQALYSQYFVEAQIELKIESIVPNSDTGDYITLGLGRLDLSDLSQSRHLQNRYLAEEETDEFLEVSCKINMAGFAQNILNNREKLFNVNFTESIESKPLLNYPIDSFGFELPLHSKAIVTEGNINGVSNQSIPDNNTPNSTTDYIVQAGLTDIVLDEFGETLNTTPVIIQPTAGDVFEFFTANSAQTYRVRVTGQLQMNCDISYIQFGDNGSAGVALYHDAIINPTNILAALNFTSDSSSAAGVDSFDETIEVDAEFTVDLSVGETIKLFFEVFLANNTDNTITNVNISANLQVEIISTTFEQSTTSKSYLIYELLDKLLSFNTSVNDALRSSFYGRTDSFPRTYTGERTLGSGKAITNGSLVRKFPNYQDVTVTLKQFLEDIQSIDCVGWSVETETGDISDNPNLRVEFIDYFFQNELIFKFTNPNDLDFQVATFLLQNRYEIGYKKYEDDFESTLDGTHTTRDYNNHLTAVSNGESKVSELIADGYALENARRQSFSVKPKESFKYDEDNFVIQCLRAEFKVVIVGFDNDKIIIRRGSAISDEGTFNSFNITSAVIANAGANDGLYTVLAYEEIDTPDDFTYEQRIQLNGFVATPADLQSDSYAIIRTSQDKFFAEQDQNFEVQNLIDPPSAYNLRITPTRNLMRWFRLWKSAFYKFPFQFFKFVRGIQNFQLVTNLTGINNTQFEDPAQEIAEDKNFVASDDKQAILTPQVISFENPLNIEVFAFILTGDNRYKEYSVTTDGKVFYKGFLDRIAYSPVLQKAEVSLIAEIADNEPLEPTETQTVLVEGFACNAINESGGEGITTINVNLSPNGGVLIFGLQAFGSPDKFEGLHNGIKVCTSGMVGIDNTTGPYDNTIGINPTLDQYIGSSKGVIPNRITEFEADTGITTAEIGYDSNAYQQLLWWAYTSTDYQTNPVFQLQAKGEGITSRNIKRYCYEAPTDNPAAKFSNSWNGGETPQVATISPATQTQVDNLDASQGDSFRIQIFYNGIWYDETKTVENVFSGGFDLRFLPNYTFLGVQEFIGTVQYARARNITKSGVYVDLGREIPASYPV